MDHSRQYRKGPNNRINQVRLSESLQSRLRDIADREDRSLSYVIRKACEEYAIRDDLKEFAVAESLDRKDRKPKPLRSNNEASSS